MLACKKQDGFRRFDDCLYPFVSFDELLIKSFLERHLLFWSDLIIVYSSYFCWGYSLQL